VTMELSAKQRPLVALLLLVLAVGAVVALVAWPVRLLHAHYDRHIEEYSDRLARYRRIAALQPDIETAIAAVEKRDSRKFFLKATSPTLAAAELQGLVTKIIESHDGKILSSQSIPNKDDAKTATGRIAMSINLGASIVSLQLILRQIEVSEPYLFIDQLTIRANQGRAYRPVPGVQPEFSVQMTVSAYMPTVESKR